MKGEATFFGRFLDGFAGIIIISCMKIALSTLYIEESAGVSIMWLGLFAAVLTPMHHLFYDRFSTFVRWIREEGHQIEISPYPRTEARWISDFISYIPYIMLYCLPLYYWTSYGKWLLALYFMISIALAIHTFIHYTKLASDHFRIKAKQHR